MTAKKKIAYELFMYLNISDFSLNIYISDFSPPLSQHLPLKIEKL